MKKVRKKRAPSNLAPRTAVITGLRSLGARCDRHAKNMQEHPTFRTLATLLETLANALEATRDDLAWLLLTTTAVSTIAEARALERIGFVSYKRDTRR